MTISRKPKPLEKGHSDIFQTPISALDCLVPHLKSDWMIWEPACGKGNLVRGLLAQGFGCIGTDLANGSHEDFMTARPKEYDAIVTNPPFSIKQKFLARCYNLGKPFALLMPITTFDSERRRQMFHQHGIQLILPNLRMNFETPNDKGSKSWFYTAWFTNGLGLPDQLNFHGIERTLI